jgi:hypothetical protein
MHDIAMDLNLQAQQNAEMCVAPIIFMNRDDEGDGYELFRQHAIELGRADQWVAWSADESCPQAGVAEDTPVDPEYSDYCMLPGEPMDPPAPADEVRATFDGGSDIPDNDSEGLQVSVDIDAAGVAGKVSVALEITHTWRGDLEVALIGPNGTEVMLREREGSGEDDLLGVFSTPAFDGIEAAGQWTLRVSDLAQIDTGRLESAELVIDLQ